MVYHPGALDAALAAAVGDEPSLIAELREVFLEGAETHLEALRAAENGLSWGQAAHRLHSLAAGFGAVRLMTLAEAAMQCTTPDARLLNRLTRALTVLREEF